MHLLQCTVFVEAHYLSPTYINIHMNHLADDLSRNNLSSFLSKVPYASPHASLIPIPLHDLLLNKEADWTSPTWHQQFSTILNRV